MKGRSIFGAALFAAAACMTTPLLHGDMYQAPRGGYITQNPGQSQYSPNQPQKMTSQDWGRSGKAKTAQQDRHPANYFKSDNSNKTVLEQARENPSLSTFVTAVEASGLSNELDNDGPFTIFAPTNEAFRQLPRGSMERLFRPENQRELYMIISYHIVPGQIAAKDAKNKQLRTINGKNIDLDANRGNISVDEAEVIREDIKGNNGVIHVIDSVLIPNQKQPARKN